MVGVRRAAGHDVDAVRQIVDQAYAPYVARMHRRPAPMNQDHAEAIRTALVWVAEVEDEVVGVAVAYVRPDHMFLETVAVLPQAHRQGIGSVLLGTVEAYARAQARQEVRLYTNEVMSENLGYYPRRGYRETHRSLDHGYHRVYFSKRLR